MDEGALLHAQLMVDAAIEQLIGPELSLALSRRGYDKLTEVQTAVLNPTATDRDLRISSQTGSGKTVAIGFVLRDVIRGESQAVGGVARPLALVLAPTRELAKQVELELSWLLAPLGAKVTSVTGGGGYRDERRAFAAGPALIVGTPGRLLDHLNNGAIDPSQVGAVVLDEADRMLDMGFRDDLEAILAKTPEERRTHLMSATFSREVSALANKVQRDALRIEGTPLGKANADIEHIVHLVLQNETLDATVNLLLAEPEACTLIFAKTRADVADLSQALRRAGFRVNSLSGDMDQRERTRALADFKDGRLDALVATDVAARGIDVDDILRVIQIEPPSDPDTYIHRSGRTGRAGRKGTSILFTTPRTLARTSSLLSRARIPFQITLLPGPEEILAARDARIFEEMTKPRGEEHAGYDPRTWDLAKRFAESANVADVFARFIEKLREHGPSEPRTITRILPEKDNGKRPSRDRGPVRFEGARAEGGHKLGQAQRFDRAPDTRVRDMQHLGKPQRFDRRDGPANEGGAGREPGPRESSRGTPQRSEGGWVPFRVTWGAVNGADARRVLAMACRRGGIQGNEIGSIRIESTYSLIEVQRDVAQTFARAAGAPDPRDPRVRIEPYEGGAPSHSDDGRQGPRRGAPDRYRDEQQFESRSPARSEERSRRPYPNAEEPRTERPLPEGFKKRKRPEQTAANEAAPFIPAQRQKETPSSRNEGPAPRAPFPKKAGDSTSHAKDDRRSPKSGQDRPQGKSNGAPFKGRREQKGWDARPKRPKHKK